AARRTRAGAGMGGKGNRGREGGTEALSRRARCWLFPGRPYFSDRARTIRIRSRSLDQQTRDLVRFAAAIAQGYEPELRERVGPLRSSQVPVGWVEELLLQSVLMVGYPRALIAFGVWRKFSGVPAPESDEGQNYAQVAEWTGRGEEVCARVYGENYRKLRESVRTLH